MRIVGRARGLFSNAVIGAASLLVSVCVNAQTLDELLADGQLEARLVLESKPPHIQKAPIIMAVEIGTPRWFARGTRINQFRIPGAIVRSVSAFADNQSERRGNTSWSLQRWRYRVYAQKPGRLSVPAVTVRVAVNHAEHGEVSGELALPGIKIDIQSPAGIGATRRWLATTAFQVDERWEGLRDNYQVGDAITRVRRFSVVDTPGMMIEGSPAPVVDGLSLYAAPALVEDESSRGQLTGIREERLVVAIERPGDYVLAGLTYTWFSIDKQTIEETALADFRFTATAGMSGGLTPDTTNATVSDRGLSDAVLSKLLWLAVISILVSLVFVGLRRLPITQRLGRRVTKRIHSIRAHGRYRKACKRGDAGAALNHLYALLCEVSNSRCLNSVIEGTAKTTLRRLLDNRYAPTKGSPLPSKKEIDMLWYQVSKHRDDLPDGANANRKQNSPKTMPLADSLMLNPKPSRG